MEHAYIILAHRFPSHVLRLIKALEDSYIFLHVDKRNESVYNELKQNVGNNDKVFFIKRYPAYWGGFGLVEAAIEGLQFVSDQVTNFQFVSLLSGQDYPIKDTQTMNNFLFKNTDKSYLQSFSFPYSGWKDGGLYRINKYYFGDRRNPDFSSRQRMFFWNQLLSRSFFFRKNIPYNMHPYGGAQWWTLNRDAVLYILDFLRGYPLLSKYFKTSLVPDEMFFQTILMNSHLFGVKLHIDNSCLREIDYLSNSEPYPVTYTLDNYPTLLNSSALFARKFEPGISKDVLAKIDQDILKIGSFYG